MSDAESTPTDDAEPDAPQGELSFDEGRQQTQAFANKTKEYVAHLPEGGIWRFEYEMVNVDEIAESHTTVRDGRQGPQQNVDTDALKRDLFCKAVVDAPDGFPLSPTKLKRQDELVKEIVGEVADKIADFSTAEEETIREFQ
jgi:hypothetical protein